MSRGHVSPAAIAAVPARTSHTRVPSMTARLFALCLLVLLPFAATAQAPVEGSDYVRIDGGQPWAPDAGGIEVVEIFSYACGHCDQFRPMLEDWKRKAGRDVRVQYLPAAYDPGDAYARGYFALEALGQVAPQHPALFDAIHREGSLPARSASTGEMVAFLSSRGLDAARVEAAMTSPATDAKMNAARDFAIRSGIHGTPTLIINGKYRVQGRTLQDSLRIADALVAMERAAAR